MGQLGTMCAEADRPARGLGNRAYYACQFFGWGLYWVLLYLENAAWGSVRASTTVGLSRWCGCGIASTHLLRTYTKSHPWVALSRLALRLAVAIPLIAAAMVAALYLPERSTPLATVLFHFVQAVLVIALWCALYFSAQEVQRRRAAEMEALRLALVAQEAQFHALRSQLNPHFLFNCLNTLRELIEENPRRAQQAVMQLSELLRYTLQADRVEMVSLRNELRAVEDYISLEKIRFEERLRLRFDIAPETLLESVPPMLVQTLVENALKHGIAKLPQGGELCIQTRRMNGDLRIQITNTGVVSQEDGSTAIGLENARQRLQLIYGNRASLALRTEGGEEVCAVLTIPLTKTTGQQ